MLMAPRITTFNLCKSTRFYNINHNSSKMKQPTKTTAPALDESIISSIVINGDLSKLSPQQKVDYYNLFCHRLGLDPISQPFRILKLNGKEILYCDRSGAQQLNKLYNLSHEITARETITGCYVVTARASNPEGRHTESIGAVTIDNLRGDNLCNAMMKAETKAKRRATLDLLGLGILDDSETDTIAGAVKMGAPVTAAGGNGSEPPAGTDVVAPAAAGGENNGAASKARVASPFKTKYETVEEITTVLETANDVKDIANLYYINDKLVEAHPDLKAKFSARKNEYYSKDTAKA